MRLEVYHLTEYHYPEEARDSFNEVWLYPVDDHRQGLLDFRLEIEPACLPRSRKDYFHNRVHDFHVVKPHQRLRVEVRATVLTFSTPVPKAIEMAALVPLQARFFEFLAPTPRIPLQHNWVELLGFRPPKPSEDLSGYLKQATTHLHQRFRYDTGATEVETPLLRFVEQQAGVCQDYAQAMLALLRSVGIPGRYISGYLHTGIGAEGSHAWVEAFIPGSGWVGFDPTNDSVISEDYIKKAHGRDYDDCPPLKGLRRGGGKGQLEVVVKVQGKG